MKKAVCCIVVSLVLTAMALTFCSAAFADGYDFTEWADDQIKFLFSQVKDEMSKRGLQDTSSNIENIEKTDAFCPNCGKGISSAFKYCPYCGSSAKKVSTSSSTSSNASTATKGEKNALASAKSYLDFTAFSYSGLISQLKYEGYSESEAKYAADYCGADWYEQAAKSAAAYLDFMPFSKSGLIEQLEYEGFTHAQAVFGAEQNGY